MHASVNIKGPGLGLFHKKEKEHEIAVAAQAPKVEVVAVAPKVELGAGAGVGVGAGAGAGIGLGAAVARPELSVEARTPRAEVVVEPPKVDLAANAKGPRAGLGLGLELDTEVARPEVRLVDPPKVEVVAEPPKVDLVAKGPKIDLDADFGRPKLDLDLEAHGHEHEHLHGPKLEIGIDEAAHRRAGMDLAIDLHKPHIGLQGELRDPEGEEFNLQTVEAHNIIREAHGVPPLHINPELVASAQRWADELAREDKFEHSANRPEDVGENIGMKWESSGTIFTGYQSSQQWYDEIDQYTFQGEENLACGHFSQVVWKGTTECGFAKAKTKDGKVLVVGHYAPAGNYVGEWAENVLPPKSGSKVQLPDWPANHPAVAVAVSIKNDAYLSLDEAFSQEVLLAHNECRAKHRVDPLEIDKDLSIIAQKHADYLAENHRFEHSRNRYKGAIIGENIACKVTSLESAERDYNGKELIDVWYSEESQYEYDGQSPKLSAGHFTQIVWKNTKVVGIGKAIDRKDSKVIVVINYYPAGNILKRFRENVNERV